MKNIDRTFMMLSNVFLALKDFPSDCPDEELVKAVAGLSGYAKFALNRVVELLTKD